MATTKTRINVSVSDEINYALKKLAQRDQIPTATKAERLLEVALEIEEDEIWDKIASQRKQAKNVRYLSHKQAWK
jgi:Arc/MetJ-type ribon-helix-helix transcriptional regulator